ncbi:MAG: NADP transhydrogenase subunit alpha [Anaerolineaceae bacterium]|nr:NADP transhydrogenase subunit alpha [Anaerolineaceae bacterium]
MSEIIAVLGSGNGGLAAAADLTLRGFRVHLFNRRAESLAAVRERGGITLIDTQADQTEFAPIPVVTTDIEQAIAGAQVIMLAVPVTAHAYYAELLAPYLTADHIVFLNPGHTGGGLHFMQTLRDSGVTTPVRTCEVSTLTYTSRITGPAEVTCYLRAREVPFAAFPGKYAPAIIDTVRALYPGLQLYDNVLDTAFLNINAIEHPPQILCNAGWVEHTQGDYYFYYEGTTPAVGRVIDAVDAERLAVADRLNIKTKSFVDMFCEVGYTTAEAAQTGSAYQALQASEPNRKIKAPKSLDHRYIHEDVGYGLVPLAQFGAMAGVPTPTMNSLIQMASIMNQIDYATTGRTLHKLGLAAVSAEQLHEFLFEGDI